MLTQCKTLFILLAFKANILGGIDGENVTFYYDYDNDCIFFRWTIK